MTVAEALRGETPQRSTLERRGSALQKVLEGREQQMQKERDDLREKLEQAEAAHAAVRQELIQVRAQQDEDMRIAGVTQAELEALRKEQQATEVTIAEAKQAADAMRERLRNTEDDLAKAQQSLTHEHEQLMQSQKRRWAATDWMPPLREKDQAVAASEAQNALAKKASEAERGADDLRRELNDVSARAKAEEQAASTRTAALQAELAAAKKAADETTLRAEAAESDAAVKQKQLDELTSQQHSEAGHRRRRIDASALTRRL